MDTDKVIIAWLKNAYAMEKELVEVLAAHRDQADGYPDVQAKIGEHLQITKKHEEQVEACIRELGDEPATIGGKWATFKGNVLGVSSGMKDDRVIKNGVMDFSVEYYEIALYTAIKTAAEGRDEIVTMCEEIINEEQEMADWLEKNLPNAVEEYLSEE